MEFFGTRERRRRVSFARTLPKGDSVPVLKAALVILAHSSTNSPLSTLVEKASARRTDGLILVVGTCFCEGT